MSTDPSNKPSVIVIGGGAAGLIAAWRAACCGAQVTLIEKNTRLGMKILISGGGKCNLTHAGPIEEVRKAFRANEATFLTPAFYRFSNQDFLDFVHAAGLTTYVRPDGRVFPTENYTARDVVGALSASVRAAGAFVMTNVPLTGIAIEAGRVRGVLAGERLYEADRVVIAVGGSSYPDTGTTGDGWRWAANLGHKIVPLRAALAPLNLEDAHPDWSGISLRDVVLRARQGEGGKEYVRWRGDLLFTHKGLSGPCALGISREIGERMASGLRGGGIVEIDLAPDLTFEALQTDIQSTIRQFPRRSICGIVARFLPERLESPLWTAAAVDPQTRGVDLSKKDCNRLVNIIKGWSMGPVRSVPLERGEVVAGGISLDEVDSRTMRSKIVPGLWFCGEVLDIAGPVGGYNLQAAWSTGFVAGEFAAILT